MIFDVIGIIEILCDRLTVCTVMNNIENNAALAHLKSRVGSLACITLLMNSDNKKKNPGAARVHQAFLQSTLYN